MKTLKKLKNYTPTSLLVSSDEPLFFADDYTTFIANKKTEFTILVGFNKKYNMNAVDLKTDFNLKKVKRGFVFHSPKGMRIGLICLKKGQITLYK
jgi:hypothetical protein